MRKLIVLPFVGLLASPVMTYAKKNSKEGRPNILFILSDDHSRAAISAYGGINAELAPTPNIDQIAKDGVLFRNMMVTNSISGPSRAALITGKYSTTNGFYQNEGGIVFDNNQLTTPMILQEAGYNTSLFGKWHLFSTPRGFDYYMIHANPGQQGTYWDPIYETNGVKEKKTGYATNITTDAAIEWLDDVKGDDEPFCMMLHYKAPHRPWDPDTKYLTLFDDVEFPHPASFDDDYSTREQTLGRNMATIENHISRGDVKMPVPPGFKGEKANEWLWYGGSGDKQKWSPDPTMTDEEVKNWKFQNYLKNYLRCVRSVDDNVGRVIEYLKANDMYDNTIIIYMGDQGFYLGEHGLYDKRWMYEESLQMPCLVSYPDGIEAGNEIDNLALNVDIAPTLLDYAQVKIPKEMHGESLRGILENDKRAKKNWRDIMYYHYFEYPKWHQVQPHYGVRSDRYKLIHYYYNIDTWEFFDLETDPNELHNAINDPQYAEIIEEMRAEIPKLQKRYDDVMTLDERRALTDKYSVAY